MDSVADDIADAEKLLEQYEAEPDHARRTQLFTDGMDILDDVLQYDPQTSHITRIRRLKGTYTRNLLEHLTALPDDLESWFHYAPILVKMQHEIVELLDDDPSFRTNALAFINRWREIAKDFME